MKLTITEFFQDTLGAPLTNFRTSWGAYNPGTNQLFLRVWKDHIDHSDSSARALLFGRDWTKRSAGFDQRKGHVEDLRNGAEGYGVVCMAKDTKTLNRNIKNFNSRFLLKFGEIDIDNGNVYTRIIDRIPAVEIEAYRTSVVSDMKSIQEREDVTTREALAHARVGQGRFRDEVLNLWSSRCCVTGSRVLGAVRASHIKPWRNSTDQERLDPNNGLPLIATLDALFDAGLITFESGGTMLISKRVDAGERNRLGLRARKLERKPSGQTAKYLAYHRQHVFVGAKGVDANETRYPMPRRL